MAQAHPAPKAYVHKIASIHETLQNVPDALGAFDLNRTIQAGMPINPDDLVHAKSVAQGLRAMHSENLYFHSFSWKYPPFRQEMQVHVQGVQVTARLVESAELTAVEAARMWLFPIYFSQI